MDDLISRQEAIDTAINLFDSAKAVMIRICKALPSAQPERERGEWYKPKEYPRDSYRYICSNCQDVAYYVTGNNGKKQKEDKPKCGYRFCPNCGAEMQKAREKNADANT